MVEPAIGLIFWTSLVFVVLLVLLKVFAWKPILSAVNKREQSIREALESAELAKEEIARLTADNKELLKEAHIERDNILKRAKEVEAGIIAEAKNIAKVQADKLVEQAREVIQTEKQAAVTELKNQVAVLSIEIAEKIVREQLSDAVKQKALATSLAEEVVLN